MLKIFNSAPKKAEFCKVDVVREILRTLGRIERTPLVEAYWRAISSIVVDLYDAYEVHPFAYDGASEGSTPMIESRRGELKHWLDSDPQYVFSLVVGLATGSEDFAWAMAYG
jgi:hypothetical protein